MPDRNLPKTDRRFACLRLLPEEKELIAGLGQESEQDDENLATRDLVMRLLGEIAKLCLPEHKSQKKPPEEMDFGLKMLEWQDMAQKIGPVQLTKAPKRSPIRVSVPARLDYELNRLADATGRTKIEILAELARHFRQQYELAIDPDLENLIGLA